MPSIPVAGADRLVLTEHIAVMDLMVLADALLLPDDDLALATVLKSPLFGFDDDDLFEIAWQRADRCARRCAPRRPRSRASPRRSTSSIATRNGRAATRRSHSTAGCSDRRAAASVSSRDSATRPTTRSTSSSISRSTTSAARRRRCRASSPGCARRRTDVKRDMEITRDEVRVMTVHGAKGLEAPIVILADTITPPAGPPQRQPRLLALPPDGAPGAPERFVWAGPKANDFALVTTARERARRETEEEYRRLSMWR